MNELLQLTLAQARLGLRNRDFSAVELAQAYLEACSKASLLNAYVWRQTPETVLEQAAGVDKAGAFERLLDGIPLGIKDIFCTKGIPTTACSRMLQNFKPVYESTVTQNLWNQGAIMLGKLNMDEFAMGSSTENSIFGATLNPWRRKDEPETQLVAGGSSGGSSSAVAALLCLGATGTDTGGSIRQPASYTGIVGIKPTYGRCSRFGIIAYASSMDQAGPMARTVEDAAILLTAMAGHDPRDSTSVRVSVPNYPDAIGRSVKGLTVGIPKDFGAMKMSEEIQALWLKGVEWLKDAGCSIQEMSLPYAPRALEAYYILAPAECSSNLARYDGVRYGFRSPDAQTIEDVYVASRTEGFGPEVRRRIMIGTYVLSVGHSDDFFIKATKLRRLVSEDFRKAFEKVDAILTPSAPTAAFARGAKTDPLDMYFNDIMTVPVNLAGLPAISVPAALTDEGLPLGLQLIGRPFDEETLFTMGAILENSAQMTQHLTALDRWWEA